MSKSPDLDEAYGLVATLCEHEPSLPDGALLCVMEAFNDLSELSTSPVLQERRIGHPDEMLARALQLVDRVAHRSGRLDRTLPLLRAQRLLSQALEAQS